MRRVHLRIEAETDITFSVRVGGRDSTASSYSYTPVQNMTADQEFVDCLVQGRYIAVEVSATTDKPWRITGIDLEAEMRGYH